MVSLLDGSLSSGQSSGYEKLAPYPPGLNAHSSADRFGECMFLNCLEICNIAFILHLLAFLLSLHVTVSRLCSLNAGTVDKPKDKLGKDETPYGDFTTYCLAGASNFECFRRCSCSFPPFCLTSPAYGARSHSLVLQSTTFLVWVCSGCHGPL